MKLKVCGMRNPQNIMNLEQQVQPDWMGLIFYPGSSRFVQNDEAFYKHIGLKKVGVFVDASFEMIQEKANSFGLGVIQLHGNETVDFVKRIKEELNLEVFKVIKVKGAVDWKEIEGFLPLVDYFLFDTYTKDHGGSGRTFNWEVLKTYPFDKPFLLSGGLDDGQVSEIWKLKEELPQLAGIDINSKFETSMALKDISKIVAFKKKIDNPA